jgi:formiminotetrahydrofolate cyclodeaminase
MSLSQRPFIDLLRAFRSPDPTPGGGSASALSGAVGASLLAMVAALPKTRAEKDEDLRRLRAAGERCAALSDRLAALMDADTTAYDDVVAAFKLPKATDAEKATRGIRIQEALRGATEVPLEVIRVCVDALEHGVAVAEFGNRSARSDVRVGLELLAAAVRGAKLNVEVNLETLKDAAYVAAIRDEAEKLTLAAARAQGRGGSFTM